MWLFVELALVPDVTLPSPSDSWERLQQLSVTLSAGWMDSSILLHQTERNVIGEINQVSGI